MGLKIELKPGERVMLGDCVVTNHDQRTRLLVEGDVPILREKDIMPISRADSPAKRIYLAVQLMYTSKDAQAQHELYFTLVRDILQAAPSMLPLIEGINNQILTGNLYKALKETKKLIAYEKELLDHAHRNQSVRVGGQGDGEPA
jgi:flagellar protein FlbT